MNKPFNDDPVEVLVKKFLTKDGTVLDLRLKYIGDAGLEYLSQCPDLVELEILNLERNEVTDKGIQALAKSSIITNLKELHLERNMIGDVGAKAIATSANFSYLHFINL